MSTTSVAGPARVCDVDPLRPADYRRLFAVLDDVIEAADIHDFRKTLLISLAQHFAWTKATIRHASVDGLSPSPDSADRAAHGQDPLSLAGVQSRLRSHGVVAMSELKRASEPERLLIERFCRRHGIVDAVATRIDAGVVGADYLVVAFEENIARNLERAILGKLGRQLAPLLQRHLTRYQLVANGQPLTKRELQIADLIAEGLSNGEIARRLHVTVDTVKKHLTHIFAKTGCVSRTQLALSRSNGIPVDHVVGASPRG
ncbi:helix-turn-helix transcriptional regulator [Actinoallomurus sp. CA-150999]|uniref:helix-turn-helix transcriptional regulator n=1 Tax=Actinoallomurus sp. CA-150999 TaxID=3239887 RepID=UPI003D94422C